MWLLLVGMGFAEEAEERALRIGIGAGIAGGSRAVVVYHDDGYSAFALAPSGSIRFLLDDVLIIEPKLGGAISGGGQTFVGEEQSATRLSEYRGTDVGVSLKPLLARRADVDLYPNFSLTRSQTHYRRWTEDEGEISDEWQLDTLAHHGKLGMGIQRWFGPGWTLSADVDLLDVARYSYEFEQEGVDEVQEVSGWAFASNPYGRVMFHLYW